MELSFTKMNGLGNDFIVIDNRWRNFYDSDKERLDDLCFRGVAQKLCDRKFGIGADGLLLLFRSTEGADARMIYLNADGSQVDFCGNGAACLSYFAYLNGMPRQFKLQTDREIIEVRIFAEESKVEIEMPTYSDLSCDNEINVDGREISYDFINSGVPHSVIFSEDLEGIDFLDWAPKFRDHPHFFPDGTNVNIVKIVNREEGVLEIRTYEKGVEAETLACGTGAVAASIISNIKFGIRTPIKVKTKLGKFIKVHFEKRDQELSRIFLKEEVDVNFKGRVKVDE